MKGFLTVSLLIGASLAGCTAPAISGQDDHAGPLAAARSKLDFTCVHEVKPEPSSESHVLFQHARWLQKNNQLNNDSKINAEIERLYRIAAEHDHYKANINLQNGTIRGNFKLNEKEHLRMSQNLMNASVATGYYFIGIFLRNGSAGLREDTEMSLRFFRKAADMGSAEAQYMIADKLEPIDMAPDIAHEMQLCAAQQGHGRAAVMLAIHLKNEKKYTEALELLQRATAAGDDSAAGRLEEAFRNPPASRKMLFLDQTEDLERADRYSKIWRILANYSYANPKVPEINEIVPLPPAPLPEWDGKLQWLEARLANIPPEKPSEVLIHKLAREKGLDPVTGKPLSDVRF